jgi:alpha-L-fucosidase 2
MGADPKQIVHATASKAAAKDEYRIRKLHITDYQNLAGAFVLDIPDTTGSAETETSTLIEQYSLNGASDPYFEATLFELGRQFFISSSRDNSLPPNLAGRWSQNIKASWGADETGLGDLPSSAWSYMEDRWVPRGTETAQLLYGAPRWITHDEMNISGHTGMKYSAK